MFAGAWSHLEQQQKRGTDKQMCTELSHIQKKTPTPGRGAQVIHFSCCSFFFYFSLFCLSLSLAHTMHFGVHHYGPCDPSLTLRFGWPPFPSIKTLSSMCHSALGQRLSSGGSRGQINVHFHSDRQKHASCLLLLHTCTYIEVFGFSTANNHKS